jgi:autophagy-related protein 16
MHTKILFASLWTHVLASFTNFSLDKKILLENKETGKTNTNLKNEVKTVKTSSDALREELEGFKNSGVTSSVSSIKVKELESKIFSLQEELTASFRNKAETAQSMLDLSKELKEAKLELKEKKSALEDALIEIKKLRQQNQDLEDSCHQKDQVIEVLKKENLSLTTSLKKKEEDLVALSNENTTLVTRLLEQKQKEVEAFNQVNDLYQTVQKQKDELTVVQQKYKQMSNDPQSGGQGQIKLGSLPPSPNKTQEERLTVVLKAPTKRHKRVEVGSDLNSVTINESATAIAVGCDDKTVKMYDAYSYTLKQTFYGPTESISHVAFSPNGKLVLGTSTDSTIRIWETDNGRSRHTLTGHSKKIQSAEFTGDSTKLVSGSHDRTLKIWEVFHGSCVKTLVCGSTCNDLAVSRSADMTVSAHFDNAMRFWDLKAGKQVDLIKDAHSQQITSVSFTNDGSFVLSNGRDNCLKLWDIRKFECVATFSHDEYRNMLNFNKACVSPCGTFACAGGNQGYVFIWNIRSNKLETMLQDGHTSAVTCATWSSDGTRVITSSLDKTYCVWQ